jgi:hyaluronan synthase/N-acetylglucosaminyltransferase
MATLDQAPADLDADVILPGDATNDAIARDTDDKEANSRSSWARIALVTGLPFAALTAIYISRVHLPWLVLSAYGLVSVGRVIVQSFAAASVRRRRYALQSTPMVSIVVAVRNEEPELFDEALRSLAVQQWPHFEVIVVDDGSDGPASNRALAEELGFQYYYQANAGKRQALHRGFRYMHADSVYVLTSDSDTVWQPDAISEMVATLQSDDRIGAVTGHVATLNPRDTWLTQLTSRRYWLAFEVERAAQGRFGAVTCVSGPLGGYRRDLIEQVKDRFVSQRFLGRVCTFGDDRHLTNLVLGLGYRVAYSRAEAWTQVPARILPYLRQQIRWSRSFWRESLWTVRALPHHGLWLTADCLLTILLPFQLVFTTAWYLWMGSTAHVSYLYAFLLTVAVISLIRIAPAILATRRADFLILLLFGLFHITVLLPLRFVALATMGWGGWGSREHLAHPGQAVAQHAELPPPALIRDGEHHQDEPGDAERDPGLQPRQDDHELVHRDHDEHRSSDHDWRLSAPHRTGHQHGQRGHAEQQAPPGRALGREDRRETGPERGGERRPVGHPASQLRSRP